MMIAQCFKTLLFLTAFTFVVAQDIMDRTCGGSEVANGGAVHYKIVLYGYCTLSDKTTFDEHLPSMSRYFQHLIDMTSSTFHWDVSASITLSVADECALPTTIDGVVTPLEGYLDITSSNKATPTVIQANVLLPGLAAASAVTSIAFELTLSGAENTITYCALTEAECNEIQPQVYQNQGDLYGFYNLKMEPLLHFGDPMLVLSALGCSPRFIGAIPYETSGENASCECICPFGYKMESLGAGLSKCKAIPSPIVEDECSFLDQCYKVTVKQSTGNPYHGNCALSGYFTSGKIIIPYPWDNYVAGRFNQQNKGADIHVHVTDLGNKKTVAHRKYTWLEFTQDTNAKLDELITFENAGMFSLMVTASDYSQNRVCKTQIMITDDNLPISDPTLCNPGEKVDGKWPIYDAVGLQNAIKVGLASDEFLNNKKNDLCGTEGNCDTSYYQSLGLSGSSWNTRQTVSPSPWQLAWRMTLQDKAYIKRIQDDILSDIPGSEAIKCWTGSHTFGERVLDYQCGDEPLVVPEVDEDTPCKTGSTCEFKQCVRVLPEPLYHGIIEINEETQTNTETVVEELAIPVYDPITEIHIQIPEEVVNIQNPTTVHLSTLIDIDLKFRPFAGKSGVNFAQLPIEESVLCRYRVYGGLWTSWVLKRSEDTNPVAIASHLTPVLIQCWSKVGPVVDLEVAIHTHTAAPLDPICDEFYRTVFYQSHSSPEMHVDNHGYCSIPESDFAEITFDFDHDIGIKVAEAQNAEFRTIHCKATFLNVPDSPAEAPVYISTSVNLNGFSDPNIHVIEQYAVELIRKPTDLSTLIEFSCTLEYEGDNGCVTDLVCSNILTFRDCDAPVFPIAETGSELKTCIDTCPNDAILPYGYCGNNYLHYVSQLAIGKGEAVFDVTTEGKCCDNCGPYECLPLKSENVFNDGMMKRCEKQTEAIHPVKTETIYQPVETETMLSVALGEHPLTLFGMLATIVIGAVLMLSRRTKDGDSGGYFEDKSGYTSLA